MTPSAQLLLLLAACSCRACEPGLPNTNNNADSGADDTGPDTDSAPTDSVARTDSGDTGPPPACAFPEVEPNDYSSPQAIPMEVWVCGDFDSATDIDIFTTELTEGWVKVWVRAADLGSASDVQLLLGDDDGDYVVYQESGPQTTDPTAAFLLDEDRDFTIQVRDTYQQYGEENTWQMMATGIKAPVEWDIEEDEDAGNDAPGDGIELESGQRVYGTIYKSTDADWYAIEVTELGSEISVDVDAFMYGSALLARATIYRPEGDNFSVALISEGTAADPDPDTSYTLDDTVEADELGLWWIKILYRQDDTAVQQGSDATWYVLQVDVDPPVDDTAGR